MYALMEVTSLCFRADKEVLVAVIWSHGDSGTRYAIKPPFVVYQCQYVKCADGSTQRIQG
jgi:hypothetical protein